MDIYAGWVGSGVVDQSEGFALIYDDHGQLFDHVRGLRLLVLAYHAVNYLLYAKREEKIY